MTVQITYGKGEIMIHHHLSIQEAREMGEKDKEEFVRAIEGRAHDSEVLYWGCSQAVLKALQQHFNLGDGEAFKAATAFGGGVARTREVCGALLGGVMVIGLAYGRAQYEAGKIALEQPEYLEAMLRAKRLCERFKEIFGALRCDEVRLSVGRIVEEAGYNTLESLEDHAKCGDVTGPTARLTAEIILEPTASFAPDIEERLERIKQVRQQQSL